MAKLIDLDTINKIDNHLEKSIIFIAENKDNLPLVGRKCDAGWDIKAVSRWEDAEIHYIGTGVKYFIPLGYELQLRMKSGTYKKTGLMLTNGIGTLDPSYRGEIVASCIRIGIGLLPVNYIGEYLFQLVISSYLKPDVEFYLIDYIYMVANKKEYEEWDKIFPTDRGTDGGLLREVLL